MILLMTDEDTTPLISLAQYTDEGLRPHCHGILIEDLDIVISQTESLLKILIKLRSAKNAKNADLSSFLTLRLGEVYVSPRHEKETNTHI